MEILKLAPNPSGGYPPIQSWTDNKPVPEGYAEVVCDAAIFYESKGFVTPTLIDNAVVAFAPNIEAYEANEAAYPEAKRQPTDAERIAALETYVLQKEGII